MNAQVAPYLLVLLLTDAAAIGLALHAWRRRPSPGAGWFALFVLTGAVALTAYAGELLSPDPGAHLFWNKVEYLGWAPMHAAWFLFALAYTGREGWLANWRRVCPFVVPAATLAFVWTNEAHGLIWRSYAVDATTPFALALSALAFGWALCRERLLAIVPLAHGAVIRGWTTPSSSSTPRGRIARHEPGRGADRRLVGGGRGRTVGRGGHGRADRSGRAILARRGRPRRDRARPDGPAARVRPTHLRAARPRRPAPGPGGRAARRHRPQKGRRRTRAARRGAGRAGRAGGVPRRGVGRRPGLRGRRASAARQPRRTGVDRAAAGRRRPDRGRPAADGADRRLHAVAVPVREAAGRAWAVVVVARDITELHAAIAERGRLDGAIKTARLVAHQLNNKLALLTGYGELLSRASPADARRFAEKLLEGALEAAAIVARLQRIVRFEETTEADQPMLDVDAATRPAPGAAPPE